MVRPYSAVHREPGGMPSWILLQAGIKIAGRNTNSLKYADDTILMAESKEELKSLLVRVEEESEKTSLKLNIKNKTKLRPWHLLPSLHGEQKGKRWKQ